ncbi:hypothetical protein DNH61_25245 [Paenibacillus sambharensis]|uniref:Integrase catalytic domain-containing protein n=1 Tax=Paenibacillus sambharensis TaxID=1803190 RepID=A0A2W1KZJ1_9BACL|nr:hypothetical protein DNH61_25245 [Paenibacillus sambharensis]
MYLNEYENPRALRRAIMVYLRFYHMERPHQSLGYAKPDEVCIRRPLEWPTTLLQSKELIFFELVSDNGGITNNTEPQWNSNICVCVSHQNLPSHFRHT